MPPHPKTLSGNGVTHAARRIAVPLVEGQDLSQAHLALIIMAISAGSVFASHVNDGGFRMVSKYFGIFERDTLKSWPTWTQAWLTQTMFLPPSTFQYQ